MYTNVDIHKCRYTQMYIDTNVEVHKSRYTQM